MATVEAAPLGKFRVAPRFSNHFEINKRQSELDFVDVLLNTDIPLYIDPFALSIEEDDLSKECNNLVVGFFQELVDALRAKRFDRAREVLNNLHEPNETRLGQSSGKPQGRGVGYQQARGLYRAFADSKAVETGLLTDLSDCELFIDGIGHDKISDVTTNIIRRKLVEFTKEQCRQWDVPMQVKPTGPWWDQDRKVWRSTYDYLPVYRGRPLILVRKRSVRYSMAIDDREFYNMRVVEFIREEFNRAECLNPNSSLFKLLKAGKRVTKKDVAEAFPKFKDFLRQVAEKFPDVLEKYKRNAKCEATSGKGKPTDFGIYELEKQTAHNQGFILYEEIHLHFNNVGGDNFGSVGQGNRVVIKDVKVYKLGVDASQTIGPETKELLKQAFDAIEAAQGGNGDKDEAKENLQKLTDKLEGDKEPGRISRFVIRLSQVVPAAAAILKGGQDIVNLLSHLPNPFGG
jgi:hypothetical protein